MQWPGIERLHRGRPAGESRTAQRWPYIPDASTPLRITSNANGCSKQELFPIPQVHIPYPDGSIEGERP